MNTGGQIAAACPGYGIANHFARATTETITTLIRWLTPMVPIRGY
ncbi:MAG: hypothetical protein V9G20_32400 [Candidatus Promineifilaceae bacterium]